MDRRTKPRTRSAISSASSDEGATRIPPDDNRPLNEAEYVTLLVCAILFLLFVDAALAVSKYPEWFGAPADAAAMEVLP
jgi:hypothetical protein